MSYGLYKCPTCYDMGSDDHDCPDDSCSFRRPLELVPFGVDLDEWIARFPEYRCQCCGSPFELDAPLVEVAG